MSKTGTSCEIPRASWLIVQEIAGTKYIGATVVSFRMAILHLSMAASKRSSSMYEKKYVLYLCLRTYGFVGRGLLRMFSFIRHIKKIIKVLYFRISIVTIFLMESSG